MTFALSTHLFHGERLTRSHLEAAARAGFGDLEIFATRTHFDYADERAVAQVGAWLGELGLSAGSMHAPICASFVDGEWGRAFSNASSDATKRQEAVDETTRAISACRTLGTRLLVLHLGLPRGQTIPSGDNDPRALQRSLEEIAHAAAQADVRLALELIPNGLSTPESLIEWIEESAGLETSGVCLDVGHAHVMGDVVESIETLSGHVITTHLHDNRRSSDDHLVPFEGSVDWTTTLAGLWKIGYDGRLVFEVADHGDAPGVLNRTVGARTRLQAILNNLSEPFDFRQEP